MIHCGSRFLIFLSYPHLQLIDEHREVLDKAKAEYEKTKRAVDELRASEVLYQ